MNMGSYRCCSQNKSELTKIDSISSLFKLVSVNYRLQILCILRKGKHCVCEIEEHIDASQSLISHHLKDLKDAGLITDQKKGLNVFYSLTPEGKMITDLLFKVPGKKIKQL